MAEINTGLGWAAKDDWLVQGAGATIATLKKFGGSQFPGQPIPQAETGYDVQNYGVTLGYANGPGGSTYYLAACYGVNALLFHVPPNAFYIVTEAATNNALCYTRTLSDGTLFPDPPRKENTSYSTVYGLAYYRHTASSLSGTFIVNPTIPVFSSEAEGMAAIETVTIPFTKSNAGYSVYCTAKWKTQAGATINTPILISSESAYTDMEETSGTYNLAKLNILRQGMRFYMSFFDIADGSALTPSGNVLDLSGPDEPARTLEQVFAYIADLDHAAILVLNSPDPYQEETDASGEEGGGGEELEDDPVEEDTLPLPSVAGHGFCTIYVPSSQELGAMASYLWSGSFDVSQVLKLFSNPMDSILGLSAVPVSLSGSPEQIYLGGVALTGITMPKYTGRTSVKVDFGTVTVGERWGSYLDYAPYTDFSIYLPFIGIKPIKADDIMGKTISLMYAIDILSGGCVAYLRPAGGSVLYEWSGQCAVQIPVTGRSYDNVFQSAMSVATATLAAVAAPASAPVLSGAVASAAVQAAATKPHIERSGTVNGITGFLGQLRPYLIRTIPEAYIPADQNKFIGYPAYINVDLASVVGYNEVDSIHLENVTATGAELDEIETILKGGVIF